MSVVLLEVSDRIATVTLNRPEARNALSSELLRLLPEKLREADERESIRPLSRRRFLRAWRRLLFSSSRHRTRSLVPDY